MELVVNWHITEACNFKCKYCFAHWEKSCKQELLHHKEYSELLLTQIALLPEIIYQQTGVKFTQIRLNLVGGETFLYKKQIKHIIHFALMQGFHLSAITNGSTLDDELIYLIGHQFNTIGFSVDSLQDQTNLLIGREMRGKAMQAEKILQKIAKIREINAGINIKINTVVNHLNYKESLLEFIRCVQPNKWKVFKMLPITTDALSITDKQFQDFLDNHTEFNNIISSENNEEMTHAYLMIDPHGRFFYNLQGNMLGYQYSDPILQVGIEDAFSQIIFDIVKFQRRY